MRAFIAIDFDFKLKAAITAMQADLKHKGCSGRWKYKDNFHLTLKFLDEINEKQTAAITQVMNEICSSQESFNLNISCLGSFRGRESIRVLWLGLGGDMEMLGQLHERMEAGLENIGFPSERRKFSPHITIAQDVVLAQDELQLQKELGFSEFPAINADRLYLFKSEQIAGKRLYTPMKEFILRGKKDK